MMAEEGMKSWAAVLPRATAAYNKTPKEPLHGDAPKEVQDDPQVKFMLLQDNARALQHNQNKTDKKAATLQETREFRAPLPQATSKFKRSFQPTYGDVKKVQSITGSTVTAQDGFQTDLKLIKIVPANSKEPVRPPHADDCTASEDPATICRPSETGSSRNGVRCTSSANFEDSERVQSSRGRSTFEQKGSRKKKLCSFVSRLV